VPTQCDQAEDIQKIVFDDWLEKVKTLGAKEVEPSRRNIRTTDL